MEITFCGAARCVTGSCFLVKSGSKRILVDCGMRQGADVNGPLGEGDFIFDPSEIDALLLTHAHIDHSGLIPLLVKRGFGGKVFTTRATADLAGIMLPDSGFIQEQEAEYQNRKNMRANRPLVEPLYTAADAQDALKRFTAVEYGDVAEIVPGMRARFSDIGHLLGSAAIELWANEDGRTTKAVFSGDIGRADRPILRDPARLTETDYLIVEGTYGDREHEATTSEEKETEFAAVLKRGIARGGNIVIPSFAVGRTQELLYYIRTFIDHGTVPGLEHIPVYIDSPLGINATRVYERCAEDYYDEDTRELAKNGSPFDFKTLKVAQTADESKLINFDKAQHIVISSSGMCDAGRIRHHLKHNLFRPESTVVFAGYQAVGTLGRMLTDGVEKVKLFGEEIHVAAAIERVEGFSGHAGRSELIEWVEGFEPKPRRVFLVHGESETLDSYGAALASRGHNITIPELGETVSLDYSVKDAAAVKLPQASRKAFLEGGAGLGRKLDSAAREWGLNGAFTVLKDGQPIVEMAYGEADESKHKRNTLDTTFPAGSFAMPVTAAVLILLEKQGKIDLDAKLSTLVPEYSRGDGATVAQLLRGEILIPDYKEYFLYWSIEQKRLAEKWPEEEVEARAWRMENARFTAGDVLSMIDDRPTLPADGDNCALMSNYRILGLAAERAGGESLSKLMRRMVFDPLAMGSTALGMGAEAASYLALSDEGSKRLEPYANFGGETGLTTTASDMALFLEAVRTGSLLGEDGMKRMFPDSGAPMGWEKTHGWYCVDAGLSNASCLAYISFQHGASMAVLSNAPWSIDGKDSTGCRSLTQRLRHEMDAEYLQCVSPQLTPIADENFYEALCLDVVDAQRGYVAPNGISLAEAYANKNVARAFAVTQSDVPVGFVMLYVDEEKRRFDLWRFMIDSRFQGKGFGKAAMALVMEYFAGLGAEKVSLSVEVSNARAAELYSSFGFKYTGRVSFGEAYMEVFPNLT